MERFFGSENFSKNIINPVVALGNFDGVHIGHKKIIESAIFSAKKVGGKSVVYTFDPHPVRVLSPSDAPPLLQTLNQKLDSIEKLGVDIVIIESFTHSFAALDAQLFFETVLVNNIHAKGLIVGYDFTCGIHRKGTIEFLEKLGATYGIKINIVDAQFLGDTLISSTNIRRLLEHGDVKSANLLLGRPYLIEGKVVKGRGLGGNQLVHTANIETQNELIPKNGVYITNALVAGHSYSSVTSIGNNPTFKNSPFSIETHLIDINMDVLGMDISIKFIKRARDQITFDSVELLREQINIDINIAREEFRSRK